MTTITLQDRRKGALYGQAIGDALGAFYEFSGNLQPGGRAEYKDTPNGWVAGEWTDDTEQAIVLLKSFVEEPEDKEKVALIIARGFQRWLHENGKGCGNHTAAVLTNALYSLEPLGVAKEVWEDSRKTAAPNGGVMRMVGVPLVRPWDEGWVAIMSELGCRTTHADPRCVASVVAASNACASLLRGTDISAAFTIARAGGAYHEPGIAPYLKPMSLKELDLGGKGIGYTYKCVGAGFWALGEWLRRDQERHDDRLPSRFESILNDIIREGGDTDTNACVAGALMGAHIGFSNLPKGLVDGLLNTEQLDKLLKTLERTDLEYFDLSRRPA